ncbi:MAG: BcsE family c-di-GMP-binding protein [Pseudomonas sp.]
MCASTLGLPGLPDRQAEMRAGGLYWLACESPDTANRLCRQLLTGQPLSTRAFLVNAAGAARDLLESLPEDAGPGRLALFDLPLLPPMRLIQALRQDVPRVRGGENSLWIIRVPLAGWDEVVEQSLADWCAKAQRWLKSVGSTLLVVGDSPPPALLDILLSHNDCLSGLGQAYVTQGARHLLLHFWCNESGVSGPEDVLLLDAGDGFLVQPRPELESAPLAANDQRQVLALSAALDGELPPTDHWQLFDTPDALLARALEAQAATVVFALAGSEEVPTLAVHLHRLRMHCGRSLKLLVRDMGQGLRNYDEQLLQANGANLVVPPGTPFLRFLELLRSIQGHRWQRPLAPEPSTLLRRMRPLKVRGSLSPRAFAVAVKKMLDNTSGTEIRHQLLRLQPLPALGSAVVLQQLELRGWGDIVCVVDGSLYLFLFACSEPALEARLHEAFRLPWRELVSGFEAGLPWQALAAPGFQSDALPLADAMPLVAAQAAPSPETFQPLRPRPVALAALEGR